MKKFLVLIFMLFAVNSAFAANWTLIQDNLYYDLDSLEFNNNKAELWIKEIIHGGYVKQYVLIDFGYKKFTINQSHKYNMKHELISSDKNSVTQRIIPDTKSEKLYNYFLKKTPSVKNVNNADDVDFGPYMQELQRRIKLNWNPPKGSESKIVVVSFKIAKDGRLLSYKIKESSGNPNADKAAIYAIKLTSPFRALPSQYNGQSVDIDFTFDYKVFGT